MPAEEITAQAGPSNWFECDYSTTTQCDGTVPSLFVDLRNDPSQKWYSCKLGRGDKDSTCCNIVIGPNDQCIEFKVLVHPQTQAILLQVPESSEQEWQDDVAWYDANFPQPPNAPSPPSPGAKPSINTYRINCGPLQGGAQGDEPACLTSSVLNDTIFITFCQTGNNDNVYRIKTIKAELDPDVEVLAEGCGNSLTVHAEDIDVSSITWNSTQNPFYNTYLSTTCCDTTITVYVPKGSPLPPAIPPNPPVLTYEMCADPIGAGSCPSLAQICTTVNVVVLSPPAATVNAPTVCPGPPYAASINSPVLGIVYEWYDDTDGGGGLVGTGNSHNYLTAGDKSVVVIDPTIQTFGYDECAYDTVNFTINLHPVPPAEIIGPDSFCINVNNVYTAVDAGPGAYYQWNFGSGAIPSVHNGYNNAGRGPISVRWTSCGNKTITLTVLSPDGCDSTTFFTVYGDTDPPDLTGCNLPNPIVECGGLANNNAAILTWHNNNLTTLQACAQDQCPVFVYSDFNPVDFTPDPSCGGSTTAGSITVEYRVSDSCQSSFISATFTIVDNTPPTITDPNFVDMSFECVGDIPAPDTNFSASDSCGGNVSIVWLGDSPSGSPCNLTIVRSYQVTDACGNDTILYQNFNINDITDPTITCPGPETIEGCDESILATSLSVGNLAYSESNQSITLAEFQAIGGNASDNCGIADIYYFDSRIGSCPLIITRTFFVVDSCGRTDNCTQTITVDDTTDPMITCGGTQTLEGCDVSILGLSPSIGSLGYSTGIQTISLAQLQAAGGNASDNCSIDSIYYYDAQGGNCPIVVTRTFVVVDTCGNSDQCQQIINIDDTTPPTVDCPPQINLEACGVYDLGSIAAVGNMEYSETNRNVTPADLINIGGNAWDSCGVVTMYYYDSQSGSCPITVMRTFVAIDFCGNQNQCILNITIDDTTDPTISCPATVNLSACGVYDLSSIPAAGNLEYSETFRDITLAELQALGGAANDNCGIDSLYYFDSQTGTCPIVITRTFRVVDSCENRVECTQQITIDDPTNPTISCPANETIEGCSEADLATATQVANLEYSEVPRLITLAELQSLGGTAGDNCGIDSLYYVDSRSGSCPLIITRIFTVVDSCGNRASCTQTIQVDDTTNPVLSCPPDADIEACDITDLDTSLVLGNLGYSETTVEITVAQLQAANGDVTDNCVIDTLYYFDSRTGSCPVVITRTFVVMDSCGNSDQCVQTIRIYDTTDPIISCPPSVTIEGCDVTILATSIEVASLEYSETVRFIDVPTLVSLGGNATDICGIDSLYYFDAQSDFCPILVTRTFVAVDSCNNRVQCVQEIYIDDTTLPTITCPGPLTLEACGVHDLATESLVGNLEYSESIRIISLADLQGLGGTADDECGIDSLYYFDAQDQSCPIIVTRTFVVVDLCGNMQQCIQEITIDDTTPPSIGCPATELIEACGVYDLASSSQVGNLEYSEVPRFITPLDLQNLGGNVSDACGLDSLYYFDVQTGNCPIIITRTFVAVDSCLNRSTCTQEIQIDDTTDPILTCPASAIVEGCGTGDLLNAPEVANLEYSEVIRLISLVELQGTGGDASDNCGIDSLYYFDNMAGSCPIIVTRTFVVVDSCGNRVQCQQTVTIDDTTDPVLTCPSDQLIEGCDDSFLAGSVLAGNLEYSESIRPITLAELQAAGGDASDNCFIDSLYYFDVQTGFCPTVITRTFVARDSCGNQVTCQQEIQVYDSTLPTITCPGPVTIDGCSVADLATAAVVGNLEFSPAIRNITLAEMQGAGGDAADNCGIDSLYYYDSWNSSCPIEITRTFVVVDSCGNIVSCTQEITIQDVEAPLLTCPLPVVLEACGIYDLATSSQVGNLEYSESVRIISLSDLQGLGGDASDNCGIDSLYYYDSQTGACPIVVSRTFVAVDTCGLRTICLQEIQIDDTTPPTINCPGPVTLEACGIYDLASSAQVGNLEYSEVARIVTLAELQALGGDAGDACGLDSLYYYDVQSGSCPIIVTRTFVAVDSCLNRTTCTQEITIDDTTDPTLTCPGPATVEGCGTADLLLAPEVGNLEFSSGHRPITLAELQGTGGDVTDNCGLDSLYYFDVEAGSCPITVTRTFVAIDSCGNRVECQQIVTIDDTTDPQITCPGDQLIEGCDESFLASSSLVGNLEYSEINRTITLLELQTAGGDASDNCFIDSIYYFDSQTGFCPIIITRTFVVVDSCGNTNSCSHEIQVLDTSIPTLTCPGNVVIDGCSIADLATSSQVGSLEYSETSRPISVLELQTAGGNAADDCGIDSLYYFDVLNGTCPIEITRTFVVIDSCGNPLTCTQEITIQDIVAPTLICPVNVVLEACGVYDLATNSQVGNLEYSETVRIISVGEIQAIGGDANDNCGIDSLYYYDVQSGSCPIIVTRTFVATDSCGLRTICQQEIQINDTTLPTISCPANLNLEICGVNDLANSSEVGFLEYSEVPRLIDITELQALGGNAGDACGLDSLYYYDVQSGSCPIIVTRTFVATDSCQNRISCVQEIQIDDTTDPVLTCPASVDVEGCGTADLQSASEVGSLEYSESIRPISLAELQSIMGDVSDNCGIDSLYYFDNMTGSCPITVTRTFVAVDSCGNQVQCQQTIRINDTTDPALTCPDDVDIEGCDESILAVSGQVGNLEYSEVIRPITVAEIQAAGGDASDNCFIDSLYYIDIQTGFCPIVITRTFVVVDSCGNQVQCSQQIQIFDTTDPTLSCPGDITIDGCDVSVLALNSAVGNLAFASTPTVISLTDLQAAGGNGGDNCGIEEITYVDVLVADCPIVVLRTFVVTDSCGNWVSCDYEITIDNTTEPTIICPADILVEACALDDLVDLTSLEFSTVERSITKAEFDALDPISLADDICGIFEVGYVDEIVQENCPIIIRRTFTAYDSCGLTATCAQMIQLDPVPLVDPECPAPFATESCLTQAEVDQLFTDWISQFVYNGDGCFLSITPLDTATAPAFCGGSKTILFVVSDLCGNVTFCSSTFTVPVAPELQMSCPPAIVVQCPSDIPVPYSTVGQFEAAGGAIANTCGLVPNSFALVDEISDGNTCPEIITRIYEVEDICGHIRQCSQIITVNDTIAPILIGVPTDISVACEDVPDPPVLGTGISVQDNCDQLLPLFSEEIIPGICENTYDIIRTWTASDACGNSVQEQQRITVTDCHPEVEIFVNPNPVCLDGSVTFDAEIIGNYSNPVYRWQFFWNGAWVDVPGGSVIPFTINNVTNANAGRYRLLIADGVQNLSNFDCNTLSDEVELVVLQPVAVDLIEFICEGDSYTVGTSSYNETGLYQDILLGSNGCDSVVNLDLTVIPNTEGFLDTTICDGERIFVGETSLNRDGQFVVHLPNAAGCDSTVTVRLRIQYPSFTTIRDTICEGSSVIIAGETYTAGGEYTQVLSDRFGCDSTLEIMIHEIPTTHVDLDVSVCTGESYTIGGQTFNTSGVYDITFTSVITGCDSIVTLNLQVVDEIQINLNETICVGDSFAIAGIFYHSAGTYRDTLISNAGCDSIITLNLGVVDEFITNLNEEICEGETYTVGTSVYSESGSYTDLLVSHSGCDSTVNLNLIVHPLGDTLIVADLCEGESILAGGERFSTTGIHTVVIPTTQGCDSTITVDLTVHNAFDTLYQIDLCEGESFSLGGEIYNTTGSFEQVYSTAFGCDSVIYIEVQVYERYEETLNITLCTGSSYTVGSNTYDITGSYTDSLTSIHGCDSIVHLNLSIVDIIRDTIDIQICEGETYNLGGTSYNISGSYSHTFTSNAGCDSIVTVNLSVLDILRDTTNITICSGEVFDFDGTLLSTAGSYNKDYISQAGCDSVHTLILMVTPVQRTNIFEEICDGEEFTMNGQVYSAGGTYIDTLTSAGGCDSIVALNLRLNDAKSSTISRQICQGDIFDFNGIVIDSTGTYRDTLATSDGCDSIITLNLQVNPIYLDTINIQICEGQIFGFDGQNLSVSGEYVGNFQTEKGCDSTVVLQLSVLTVLRDTTVATICGGDSYDFDGTEISVGGTYNRNYTSVSGCDSIQTLILTVSPVERITLSEEICQGDTFFLDGMVFTTSGTFIDTLSTMAGCDSIVTLNLRVYEMKSTTLNRQICGGEIFDFNGQMLDSTGIYSDTLSTIHGCDSIVTLNLQVNEVYFEEQNAQICIGQIYPFDGQSLTVSGEYTATFQTESGCDSVVVLTLEVVDVLNTDISASICNGARYDFFGTMLSSGGTYEHTLQSNAGCDSVIHLTLEVVDEIRENLNISLCEGESFSFGSQELSVSGVYIDSLTSQSGCDSIVTLNLQITPVYNEVINAQICFGTSYRFMGLDLTEAGTYTDSLKTAAGCDSIITLNLAVDDIKKDTTIAIICSGESYEFQGMNYDVSGIYEEVVSGIECDTLKVLVLTVLDEFVTVVYQQICTGESLIFDTQTLTASSTYTAQFLSNSGCDSTVTLNLEVVDALHTNLDYFICEGDSVVIDGFAYKNEGSFTDTLLSAGGCDSILHINIGQATAKYDTIQVTICAGETYSFAGSEYSESTSFVDTFPSNSGCDSIVAFTLIVRPVYEEDREVTICTGSTYTFNGEEFTVAGTYPVMYQTVSGCDSIINLIINVKDEIITELEVQNCVGGTYQFNDQTITEAGTYRDTMTSVNGCDSIIILNYRLTDKIETFETQTICEGDTIVINGHYYWQDTIFSDSSSSVMGCDSIAFHEIIVISIVSLETVDLEICEGESVQLEALINGNSDNVSLTWSPAEGLSCTDCKLPIATPSETTKYKVSTIGCLGTNIESELTVVVVPNPQLVLTQKPGPNGGTEIILSATTIDPTHTINWYDNSGQLICTDCPREILQTITGESTYLAVAQNYLGCETSEEISVNLTQDDCEVGEIIAANAMTPNGDGSNDFFQVVNNGDAEVTLIQVFNRWGEIVFEGNSVGQLWDGNFRGEPVNPGVYIYMIHGICVSGDTFILSGNVTVIR